jgi:hypothetical protein
LNLPNDQLENRLFLVNVTAWSNFGMHPDFLRAFKGAVSLVKTPPGCVLSVYTNSKIAVGWFFMRHVAAGVMQ